MACRPQEKKLLGKEDKSIYEEVGGACAEKLTLKGVDQTMCTSGDSWVSGTMFAKMFFPY